ncbi:hypothetical protein [Nitrobacter vulgaris]|uniref:Terminase n=1 Tax=Nitrobacter vulgaris TaxID=29421 RepID=A0A1V4HV24_NITVU|nr:hypothetical protein [Nitrobacter vulgaris]OPH81827.1 hypothetical protein B2M20_15220 [Nitrobacter vulgaris]
MAKKQPTPKNSKCDRRADNPGRPPRYNPDIHPKAAKALCAKGATIAELAAAFDVAISTIWLWKVSHPEFFESCRLGLEAATDRIERSMFERAVGYTHESTKIFMPAGASKPVYASYLEHVPPDPRAGEFWLTNRAPDRWKHKQKIEQNEATDSPLRLLAEQISGHAIRPRLPEPKVIDHADIEPSAIRPQQPQIVTRVTTTEPVTRAAMVTPAVDDDDDRPRSPRIHTISRATFEDFDDEE